MQIHVDQYGKTPCKLNDLKLAGSLTKRPFIVPQFYHGTASSHLDHAKQLVAVHRIGCADATVGIYRSTATLPMPPPPLQCCTRIATMAPNSN